MKILLYGIPSGPVERIAARYGFEKTRSFDEAGGAAGALLTIPPADAPQRLLALYDTMLAREAEIDAVIVDGAASGDAGNTLRCCTPQGKYYTLSSEADEEMLEYELARIVESLSGLVCALEGI